MDVVGDAGYPRRAPMEGALLQLAGWCLVLLAIADLYLTVLYARSDVGLLSPKLNRYVWGGFRQLALSLPAGRNRLLTFAGPTLLVLTVLVWTVLLWFGFALVVWPALGDSIRMRSGPTPTRFATALYYSGYTLATLGYGDLAPQTAFYRVLAVVEALVGFSVLTLSVTYFMSVYAALARRNVLALSLHHASGGTDDPAELLARLGPGGDFAGSQSLLRDLNRGLNDLYEAHHAYPILHYFHFRDPFYSMSHLAMMLADLASLARSTLDPLRHRPFVDSAGVAEAESGSLFLLTRLSGLFLPRPFRPAENSEPENVPPDWHTRQQHAAERLARSGVAIVGDPIAASRTYADLRRRWSRYVEALDRYMLSATQRTS